MMLLLYLINRRCWYNATCHGRDRKNKNSQFLQSAQKEVFDKSRPNVTVGGRNQIGSDKPEI